MTSAPTLLQRALGAAALTLALASPCAQAGLVSFDPVDEQGITLDAGDAINTPGFSFTQINAAPATLFAGDSSGYANNGSNILFAGNGAQILLSATQTGRFNIASLEVGGGSLGDPGSWATELMLIGLTADNMTLTDSVMLDVNSTGLAFKSLNWQNLTQLSFRVSGGDYSLDNLNLQAVPEPSSWTLALAALVVLLARFVQKRRATPICPW